MGKLDVLREKTDQVRSEANASALSLKNMPHQIAEVASVLEQGWAQNSSVQERIYSQAAQAIRLIAQVQDRLGEIKQPAQATLSEKELLPPPQFWQSLNKNLLQSARGMEILMKRSGEISKATSRLLGWNFWQIATLIILTTLLVGNLIRWAIPSGGSVETSLNQKEVSNLRQELEELRSRNEKWGRFYQGLAPESRRWIEDWWEANP